MKKAIAFMLFIVFVLMNATACGVGTESSGTVGETESKKETESVSETVISGEVREEITEDFEELFALRLFEGAAYVVYKGEEVYSGGAGKANKADGIDNGADVVYCVGSVTKQFTAAAVLKLCEEGKLNLDDKLGKYFPEYDAGKDITLSELLSMQSGIPDFLRSYDEDGNEISDNSQPYIEGISSDNNSEQNREALEKHIFSSELLFEPGDRYSYSNSNYLLLGGIVEMVSDVSYHEYVRNNFFEPLGMDTAGFVDSYDVPGAVVAKGYNKGINSALIFDYPGISFACGDIMASPKDMEKWTSALHGGKVLNDRMYSEMIKVRVGDPTLEPAYGYGLMIYDLGGKRIYFHTGSIPGYITFVGYVPEQDFYIALMNNHSNDNTATVAMKMMELFSLALKNL